VLPTKASSSLLVNIELGYSRAARFCLRSARQLFAGLCCTIGGKSIAPNKIEGILHFRGLS
jgi:hypothetical protein